MSFRRRNDNELDKLSDEQLIAYVREATAAGDGDAAKRGLAILVWGYREVVRGRMALRVPREAVEEAADEALVRAIKSRFDGTSTGEFRAWLGTIIERAAADWFRRRSRRPSETALEPDERNADAARARELAREGEAGAVELEMVLDGVLAKLSDAHRRVVELHVLEGRPAREVCEHVDGMTPDNVAQVATRFRKRFHESMHADGGGGGG